VFEGKNDSLVYRFERVSQNSTLLSDRLLYFPPEFKLFVSISRLLCLSLFQNDDIQVEFANELKDRQPRKCFCSTILKELLDLVKSIEVRYELGDITQINCIQEID
jgi:hypothetical protein